MERPRPPFRPAPAESEPEFIRTDHRAVGWRPAVDILSHRQGCAIGDFKASTLDYYISAPPLVGGLRQISIPREVREALDRCNVSRGRVRVYASELAAGGVARQPAAPQFGSGCLVSVYPSRRGRPLTAIPGYNHGGALLFRTTVSRAAKQRLALGKQDS